ncbi:MFS transporter [Trinickia fusca]|uniref:MFS transporter n=1 Tax=Trinickia fusca TaxID=2419777 RepID=A0A494XRS8_9BURK|nr:MFS transporter [Trinickia fusca]RKP52361.1 MFS transporter [Trinickia fusca]
MASQITSDGVAFAHESDTTRRAVIAVIIGNGFEWFDFISFSFFSVIISKLFFPSTDGNLSLLLAVSTIGVGFFMRPVGGIVLGNMADKVGRQAALTLAIALMTAGTALIAFAPTYDQAGIWAPVTIVIARLLQGFSAGGEMGGATAYLRDCVPASRRGYYTSWIQASIGLAIIIASVLAVVIVDFLDQKQINSWGWRVPFFFGLLLGPAGFYIRSRLHDPSTAATRSRARTPAVEVVRTWPREMLTGFGLVIFWTVCSYVLLFYIPTYASKVLKLAPSAGFIAVLVGASIVLTVTPIVGLLSDRFGRRPFLIAALVVALVAAYPLFALLNARPQLSSLILFQVVFGCVIALYEGPVLAAISDQFPSEVLSTGISISYNLAVVTFGGFSASIITFLITHAGSNLAPGFYVIATAALSLIAVLCWRPLQRGRTA